VLALAVAACGGSAAPTPAADAVSGEVAAEALVEPPVEAAAESMAPDAEPAETTVQVDQEAWFAGFKVGLGQATADLRPGRGGEVTIDATFENTGADDARFDGTLTLSSNGETALQGFGMEIPSVAGGTTGKGRLVFSVADGFTFDDAVLTIGRAGNQQAVLPLTPTAGEAVTLEPVEVTATGSATAGDLTLELRGGEYRADQPWTHGQMQDGSYVLTLTYDGTFESDFAGGFAFTGGNVALRLPDGTTVGNMQDGVSQSNELIGPRSTVKDLFSRFEIEEPAAGDYALLVRSFDNAEAEIPFSIR
jgi:hypothetical protein